MELYTVELANTSILIQNLRRGRYSRMRNSRATRKQLALTMLGAAEKSRRDPRVRLISRLDNEKVRRRIKNDLLASGFNLYK